MSKSPPIQNTPLAQLIHSERDRLGLSERAVATRGGLNHATLRYYLNRWPAKSLPAQDILAAIAKGLDVPYVRVQIAAMSSVGYEAASDLSEMQQVVVNAMAKLNASNQRHIADIVVRLASEADRIEAIKR